VTEYFTITQAEVHTPFHPANAGCYFEKALLKYDEYWEQSFSLTSSTTQRDLLHSLMELYAGTQ